MSDFFSRLAPVSALRDRTGGPHLRVTSVELFFDLVYVFTIIQLSHYLLEHQTWLGALQTATLFAGVWWTWNLTAWLVNWIDPDKLAGRVLVLSLMAGALLMAVAIHYGFTYRAWLFVVAYVGMAVGRSAYAAIVMRGSQMGKNYAHLCAWAVLSGIFWIAGAAIEHLRLELWILAVLIDYGSAYARYWLPGRGATPEGSWDLKGAHLLERNQLIFIIALGESILLLGGTLAGADLSAGLLLTAAMGFGLIVSIWWTYFVHTGDAEDEGFAHLDDQTALGRAGLAYAHGIMVCGAIVLAVAIETIIAHPFDAAHTPAILIGVSGPLIFLIGHMLFRMSLKRRKQWVYLVPFAILPLIGWVVHATHASGLLLGLGVLAVMLPVALFTPKDRR